MSRGLGWVQQACLHAIKEWEEAGHKWSPTTFNIAAEVYAIKRDKNGNRWVNNAQHVAVKRALEGLQRKGRIIGFRTQQSRAPGDGRTQLCHCWMTERGLKNWIKKEFRSAKKSLSYRGAEHTVAQIERITKKAKAIGMKVDRP